LIEEEEVVGGDLSGDETVRGCLKVWKESFTGW